MARTVSVTANEYLDARQDQWFAAERCGSVRYDPVTRAVAITDDWPEIQRAFLVHVSSDIRVRNS